MSSKTRLRLGGFLLLTVAAIILLTYNTSFFTDDTNPPPAVIDQNQIFATAPPLIGQIADDRFSPLATGNPAPDFTLPNHQGQPINLSDYRGQPVIINFWATWCAPCRLEMPTFQAAYEKHQADGLVILAINRAESPATINNYLATDFDNALTFPILLDEDETVTTRYQVAQFMPTTFFVDAEGNITQIHRGLLIESQLDTFLAEIL
ncbi:MAG TPA: TlpA disulfide reductase family protein [Anaerolineae bacterium]|nr:TlpA disulfide reductase family protein [Anaerolineae bacterium]